MANKPPGQARWENFRWRFGFVCGPREQLLVLATLFPLVLFALPGIAVYDGERLFLISYPIWAVLIGRGGAAALGHLREKADSGQWRLVASRRARVTVATLFLLTQGIGAIVMHPCQLSYYNLLVGGLYGADRLGFERTYWGDSLTRSLLQSLFDDKSTRATVSVEPVLHQFQLPELLSQSPILRRQQVTLMAVGDVARTRKRGEQTLETPRMQLGFLRRADFSEIHAWNPKGVAADMAEKGDPFNDPRFRPVFLKRQGVILAVGASLVSEPQDSAASPSSK